MDQNTQVYYGGEEDSQDMEGNYYHPEMESYDESYEEYGQENMEEDYGVQGFDEDDGAIYHEEGEGHRFHVAMNVFDTASILMGVVVILALTALIVNMVSWLREDIIHSFGMLQSGIQ